MRTLPFIEKKAVTLRREIFINYNNSFMVRDTAIFDIIEKEHQRQLKGIELIASENFVSDQVMQAMGTWLTN